MGILELSHKVLCFIRYQVEYPQPLLTTFDVYSAQINNIPVFMASFFLYGDSLTTPGQSTDVAAAGTVGREHAVVDPLLALDASVASEAHA